MTASGEGKDSIVFKGLATGSVAMLSGYKGNTNWTLYILGGEGMRVGRWTWEELKVIVIGAHHMKFPNNQ